MYVNGPTSLFDWDDHGPNYSTTAKELAITPDFSKEDKADRAWWWQSLSAKGRDEASCFDSDFYTADESVEREECKHERGEPVMPVGKDNRIMPELYNTSDRQFNKFLDKFCTLRKFEAFVRACAEKAEASPTSVAIPQDLLSLSQSEQRINLHRQFLKQNTTAELAQQDNTTIEQRRHPNGGRMYARLPQLHTHFYAPYTKLSSSTKPPKLMRPSNAKLLKQMRPLKTSRTHTSSHLPG
jgi:hypothetical protein